MTFTVIDHGVYLISDNTEAAQALQDFASTYSHSNDLNIQGGSGACGWPCVMVITTPKPNTVNFGFKTIKDYREKLTTVLESFDRDVTNLWRTRSGHLFSNTILGPEQNVTHVQV